MLNQNFLFTYGIFNIIEVVQLLNERINLFKHYNVPEVPNLKYDSIEHHQKHKVRKIKSKVSIEHFECNIFYVLFIHNFWSNYKIRRYQTC